MIYSNKTQQPLRQAVLVLSHADGFLEVFAERHIDVHLARVPVAYTLEGEQIADDLLELMLLPRYRDLYRADRLRKTGTTRPLLPSVLAQVKTTREVFNVLNNLATQPAEEEVVTWML